MRKIIRPGYVSQMGFVPDTGPKDRMTSSSVGFFVMQEGKPEGMMLFDTESRSYINFENVSFLWQFSNELEGAKKLPRPFIYKKFGKDRTPDELLSSGDKVKLSYMNNSVYNPIVEGSIESCSLQMTKKFNQIDLKKINRIPTRYETNNYIYEQEFDGEGGVKATLSGKNKGTGNLDLEIIGTKDNGNVKVTFNGKLIVEQKDADGKVIQSIILDNTSGSESVKIADKLENKIEMTKEGIKLQGQKSKRIENAVYGDTLVSTLKELLKAINQISVMTPSGVSSPVGSHPTNKQNLDAISENLKEILIQ